MLVVVIKYKMRKKLKIIYFIILIAYFIPPVFRMQNIIDSHWYIPVFLIFMIPYGIYESIQLIKDDKINNTNIFRNRIIMMVIVLLILFFYTYYLNSIY
jgi:hypothetical protein